MTRMSKPMSAGEAGKMSARDRVLQVYPQAEARQCVSWDKWHVYRDAHDHDGLSISSCVEHNFDTEESAWIDAASRLPEEGVEPVVTGGVFKGFPVSEYLSAPPVEAEEEIDDLEQTYWARMNSQNDGVEAEEAGQVKRWELVSHGMYKCDRGEYVLYADYAALLEAKKKADRCVEALRDMWAEATGNTKAKSCGHDFTCVCIGPKVKAALTAYDTEAGRG